MDGSFYEDKLYKLKLNKDKFNNLVTIGTLVESAKERQGDKYLDGVHA